MKNPKEKQAVKHIQKALLSTNERVRTRLFNLATKKLVTCDIGFDEASRLARLANLELEFYGLSIDD